MTGSIGLPAIGPFLREGPAGTIVVTRPDPDIRVLFPRPAEPGGDKTAGGLTNRGSVALLEGCLGEEELLLHEPGESRLGGRPGSAGLELVGGIADAVIMPDEVDPAVLGAHKQVRLAVPVEIADGRTGSVTGNVAPRQLADLLEHHLAVAVLTIAIPGGVLRVDEDVVSAIRIPVDDGKLDTSAPSRRAGGEPNWTIVLIDEGSVTNL